MDKIIHIIGVPMDLGQSQRGVDMGPSALRYAGLFSKLHELGYQIKDLGNIHIQDRETLNKDDLMTEICRVNELVYKAGQQAISNKNLPIFLGGDHSISIGSIGGVTHDSSVGIIWIDAHCDYNTPETSLTGNIHGMALATLMGKGWPELVNIGRPGPKIYSRDVVMIGVRSLDPAEKEIISRSGITIFTMRDIDVSGISQIIHMALKHLSHQKNIHVSFDLDALEPVEAPGVGTPVRGGLTVREAHIIMEIIADSQLLSSLDIVEINPILDNYNRTALKAIELTESLFGKRILM